jgi:hypothetical protein
LNQFSREHVAADFPGDNHHAQRFHV